MRNSRGGIQGVKILVHPHRTGFAGINREKLSSVAGVTLYGNAPDRGAVISFNLEGVHAHDVAQFLDSRGIAVRAGHHCAHPIMRKLGVPSTVRASLYFYNSPDEVDRLAVALDDCGRFFSRGI